MKNEKKHQLGIRVSSEVQREALTRASALAEGLYPHQVEGLAFLLSRDGAILADDMGLGKTRQAVLAMTEARPEGPHLVVCPASVKWNWAREIELARPGSEVHVVGDHPRPDCTGWVVINYDILTKHMDTLMEIPFAGVIFDEAHYLKNHTSQRSRNACKLVVNREPKPLTYLLTGTPLTNRPRDLFPLLQLIQHPLGRSFLSFAKRYCAAAHNGFGWVTEGASNLEELSLQLKGVMIRRTKEEVLDLPPKVRTFMDVDVPASTAVRETKAVLEYMMGAGRSDSDRRAWKDLLARLTKARHVLAKAKSRATIDFVQGTVEQGEKVIVFSGFDAPLQQVKKRFGDACVLLTGKTPAEKRQELVDRFQNDPDVTVFAANIVAGGVGITLTAARQVVFNDLDWVPANHWQAEDRAYRIGQSGAVHVAYMMAPGTLDAFVKQVLEVKTALVEGVIDGKAIGPGQTHTTLQELELLVQRITPGLTDAGVNKSDPDWARTLVREAVAEFAAENADRSGDRAPGSDPTHLDESLVDLLANALSGPSSTQYRVSSSRSTDKYYTLDVVGMDVTCTCPGFEYRGMCRHSRELKEHLVSGAPLPMTFEPTHSAEGSVPQIT
jgi:SNF2 family DNA or RNA helicase